MSRRSWIVQLVKANQGKLSANYLPYSAGLLQAYVMRHAADFSRYTFMPILCDRPPLAQALQQVQIADVYGFSAYVWNIEYSLALAKQIKALRPEALIIFGGPQVPDRSEDFLRSHPFIDVCVHGEGERTFLKLLEALPGKDWDHIAGISWLEQGGYRHSSPGPRIPDLDEIPSPYLSGVFDSLLADTRYEWIAMWESNRGCPFACTFCDWGSATAAKVTRYSLERLKAEIDWFAARRIKVVSCCDANFGILPRDQELTDYLVETNARTGYPHSFSIQNAKNATERSYAIQRKIIQAGMHGMVTLALQSLSPEALRRVRRENISLETYRQLAHRFQSDGVATYSDLLVGLPGETYDSFVDGICRVIEEGQHHWIQFFNVFILPNAELAQPEYRREHGIRSVRIPYAEPFFPLTSEVGEWQEMVIATSSYTEADWLRMRAFAWWTLTIYYYFKLLQLPLLVLHHQGGLPLRTLFESFSEGRFEGTPMLQDLRGFMLQKARDQLEGKAMYCALTHGTEPSWLEIEKYVITGLSLPGTAEAFFAEVRLALDQLAAQGQPLPPGLLAEAIDLSEALFLCPILQQPVRLAGRYNLWDWYQGVLRGEDIPLMRQDCRYLRDWYSEPLFDLKVESRLESRAGL